MKDTDIKFDLSDIPAVETYVVPGSYRWNVIDGLRGNSNIGIELGVAGGSFSRRMVDSGRFRRFWGVDSYEDSHNTTEYKSALRQIGLDAPFTLLRMRFDDALDMFPDGHFDFIYIDGYAHTGEEGGRTLIDWYPKLRAGGIMAGDDYSVKKWPLVVWAVNHFVRQLGVPLNVTDKVLDMGYNRFPSWFFVKPAAPTVQELAYNERLITLGQMAKAERELQRFERRQERRQERQAQREAKSTA